MNEALRNYLEFMRKFAEGERVLLEHGSAHLAAARDAREIQEQ